MSKRRINARRLSRHLSYTIEEAAECVGAHKNTVRNWLKSGLAVVDGRRPMLISGAALLAFLKARSAGSKRPLRPGEFYCFKCRSPTRPDGNIADLVPVNDRLGTMVALCPECGTLLYRRVSNEKFASVSAGLEIQILPGNDTPKRDVEPQAKL